jgi:RND family efflux transporter MFP subunit
LSANAEIRGSAQFELAEPQRGELDVAWRRFARAAAPEEFCQAWLELQCRVIGGVIDAAVVLQKPGIETFAPLAFWPEARRERGHLTQAIERALREGRGLVEPRGTRAAYVIAYPVRIDGKARGVVGLELGARDEGELQAAMRQLQWGAAWLEVLLRRQADPAEAARLRFKVSLQVLSVFLDQPRFPDAASALVTELASRLGCDRVVLGLLVRDEIRIEAVSHTSQIDRRANLFAATIAAMTEALDQKEPVIHPGPEERRLVVSLAHAELAQASGAGAVATFPLEHAGRQVGALTLERARDFRFDPLSVELLEGLAAMLGPMLDVRRTGERSLPRHAVDATRGVWWKLVGPRHGGFKLTFLLLAAIGAFLALAEGTFRVSADARIEGEVQRALTAPFNAYVRDSSARAGDAVKQGQVLARLDDRDLRVEQARLLAQRAQLAQQYRDAMARQERAQVRITSAQIAQAEAQLTLLDEQLSRTEVLAPFDGVVVSGDLTQALGAPLERGQVMLEVAPLDAYRVVLQVDEHDIAHVRLGQTGSLVLTPMPNAAFPVTVAKITPVSASRDGRNLFRVEAELAEHDPRLRPGMEGVAKIDVEERRLVWIWTHRMVQWLQLKAWAWLP